MKIITICGSLKYQKEMMEIAEKLGKEGNCILTPVYPVNSNKEDYTEEEIEMVKLAHFERIKLSDAIFVVNIDNYIGESTKIEIEYAKSLDKKIIYYTDLVKETVDFPKKRHILPSSMIKKLPNGRYEIIKTKLEPENLPPVYCAKLRQREYLKLDNNLVKKRGKEYET